jgi:hypothetical protein
MGVPQSYLLTAPSESGDVLGRGIPSHKIVSGLKKIDPRIWTSKIFGEDTCLWVGPENNAAASRKISSMPIGMIPEFTQLGPEGTVIALGWRRIFEKAMQVAGLNRGHVESAFGVTLTTEGRDGYCWSCKKQGKLTKATSKGQQCDFHRQVLDTAYRARQQKADEKEKRRLECQ